MRSIHDTEHGRGGGRLAPAYPVSKVSLPLLAVAESARRCSECRQGDEHTLSGGTGGLCIVQ